jgi:signal transduction histidine kinase
MVVTLRRRLSPKAACNPDYVRLMTPISQRASKRLGLGGWRDLAIALAGATAAVAFCTALIYPVKEIAPANTLAVIYVVAVLLISSTWGVWFGLITALESVLAFDYFHLSPVGTLSIQQGSDWVSLATFVIAATIGGAVPRVARSRSNVIASRARIIAAADAARERLARDLHDGAQQRLVTTILNLKLADQEFDRDAEGARELLRAAITDANDGLAELRELARGLHPRILKDRGLGAAAASLAARSPLQIDVAVGDERYPPHLEAAVYFFIAEALTNAAKHAQASHAEVKLRQRDGLVVIDVRDDGVGGADAAGNGIRGLRDRIESLGGQVQLESPAGHGTHLRATIASQ